MESIIKKFEHLMLWAHDQSCQAIDKNRVLLAVTLAVCQHWLTLWQRFDSVLWQSIELSVGALLFSNQCVNS